MFVLFIKGKNHLFHNSLEDDFVLSTMQKLRLKKKDVDIFYVDKKEEDKLQDFLDEGDKHGVRCMGSSGKLMKCEISRVVKDEKEELELKDLEEVKVKKVKKWPYDKDDKFIGYGLTER